MKITPVKGTADYLPNEVLIRDYLQNSILETYRSCGFERISTPIIEDIENLDKSDGGENLNLIFKIMKRGEKLEEALSTGNEKEIADMGLRYDLTLPLTRYYANNRAKLQNPFKVIQIDRVYRAERPQKGRMREFYQCDIDIIGSDSWTAEVELITTTAKALHNIGFTRFGIRINDRRLLKAIIMGAGFAENECDSVCISLDKLDKIGFDGVKAELIEKGFDSANVGKLIDSIGTTPFTLDDAEKLCGKLDCIDNLRKIMDAANSLADGFEVTYDMTLVRGQGYYTGTVFEISSPDFKGAIGGGGRYDNLIGKFLGESIPAVGFSIGFERLCAILLEQKYKIPTQKKKFAVIYNDDNFIDALKYADTLREEYDVALYQSVKKLGKLFAKLEESGFCGCRVMGQDEVKHFGE
ncbi:MAG: histidine--tRNA ligase [Eubacteriales bacterium]|nr:histidine--tRNA ligase [Eubacteriales bacterium]